MHIAGLTPRTPAESTQTVQMPHQTVHSVMTNSKIYSPYAGNCTDLTQFCTVLTANFYILILRIINTSRCLNHYLDRVN